MFSGKTFHVSFRFCLLPLQITQLVECSSSSISSSIFDINICAWVGATVSDILPVMGILSLSPFGWCFFWVGVWFGLGLGGACVTGSLFLRVWFFSREFGNLLPKSSGYFFARVRVILSRVFVC